MQAGAKLCPAVYIKTGMHLLVDIYCTHSSLGIGRAEGRSRGVAGNPGTDLSAGLQGKSAVPDQLGKGLKELSSSVGL